MVEVKPKVDQPFVTRTEFDELRRRVRRLAAMTPILFESVTNTANALGDAGDAVNQAIQ